MQMVRQNADRDGFKRILLLDGAIGFAQEVNLAHQQVTGTLSQCYREEEGAAFKSCAPIAGHLGRYNIFYGYQQVSDHSVATIKFEPAFLSMALRVARRYWRRSAISWRRR